MGEVYTMLITSINVISILLFYISYRRMVKFAKQKLREELRDAPNLEVALEKCLLD